MNYLLFILFTSSITFVVVESNIGFFIRNHPFFKEKITEIPLNLKEMCFDILHCSLCFGTWCSIFVSFFFEYYQIKMILLNTLCGPIMWGFIGGLTTFLFCSLAVIAGKLAYKL